MWFPHFWDHMGLRFWCIRFFFNYYFGQFFISGVAVNLLLLIGKKKLFFAGFTGCSYSGYDYIVDTLRGSILVNGFALDVIFIWALYCFTSLGFYWTSFLTGTLRGIVEGLALLNISDRFLNASL